MKRKYRVIDKRGDAIRTEIIVANGIDIHEGCMILYTNRPDRHAAVFPVNTGIIIIDVTEITE